ncbi:hypothetical protein DY000_02042642 [Brassica cretica]|uniref:Uncharacterized protein n=1 Tax=Brassica cretica TaxID=69181 RepID=A0ABQ7B953_BRACR|nr:hypothetical protein DY000_02042642 [Brassica cretica]
MIRRKTLLLLVQDDTTIVMQKLSQPVNTLTATTERFLSYPLMSLLRQVLQPLLQHDPEHFKELLSLSIRSASVSLCLYRRPHSYLIVILHFIRLSISPRYSLALPVYTTPAQHLDSKWSSPLNPTSASATTSATTSGQTSYIFNLPFLALCADQAQHSFGSATTPCCSGYLHVSSTASRSDAPVELPLDPLLLRTWLPSCVVSLTMSPSPSAPSALYTRCYCLGVISHP